MSAYVIVDIDVKAAETYKQYIGLVPASVAQYGGRYLARAGRTEKLEGDWTPKRLVILQFESLERAREWLDSPEYAPIKRLRHQAASSNMVVIEGAQRGRPRARRRGRSSARSRRTSASPGPPCGYRPRREG